MKKIIKLTISVIIIAVLSLYIKDNYYIITNKIEYLYKKYLALNIKQYLVDNNYKKNENYEYVKVNKNTTIKNKDELKNAIYTYLDSGWDKYIVMCDPDYLTCTNDTKDIVENKEYLTNISNFTHPFNTFDEFNTSISAAGKLTFKKKNRYTNEQIEELNNKVNEIYNNYYDSSKNTSENIKIFHDYIANNTKYDSDNTTGVSSISSSTAYGVLMEGKGICSGYADAFSLFLDKMNVKNYRISSTSHVWNLVYVDGTWKHIDLTWDDPVTSDGSNSLNHDYFLISTSDLKNKNEEEHIFNEEIYIEAK